MQSPARSSSSLTSKPIRFYNVRPLNLQPLHHHPQHFNFDLAREGFDFFLWEIEVASGLSRSQCEHIRQKVEDDLNTQVAADSVAHDALSAKDQGPLFDSITSSVSVDLTTDRQGTRVRVVAIYNTEVEGDTPTECKLFFSYPVGQDPTTAFSLLRRKNEHLLTLSKTVSIVDALRNVGASTPRTSNPTINDTVD